MSQNNQEENSPPIGSETASLSKTTTTDALRPSTPPNEETPAKPSPQAPMRHGRKPIYPDSDAEAEGLDASVDDEELERGQPGNGEHESSSLLGSTPHDSGKQGLQGLWNRWTAYWNGENANKRKVRRGKRRDISGSSSRRISRASASSGGLTSWRTRHPALWSTILILVGLLLLLLLLIGIAVSHLYFRTLSTPTAPQQSAILDQSLQLKGPDRLQLLNISDDGVQVRIDGRLGLDPQRALDIWLGERGTQGWWKNRERKLIEWAVGKVEGVRVELGELRLAEPDSPTKLLSSASEGGLLDALNPDAPHPSGPQDLMSFHLAPLIVPVPSVRSGSSSSGLGKHPSSGAREDLHPLNLTLLLKPVTPASYILKFAQTALAAGNVSLDVKVESLRVRGLDAKEMRNGGIPSGKRGWWNVPSLIDIAENDIKKRVEQKIPHMKNDTSKHELLKLTRYDFFEIGQEQPPSNESTAATDDSDNFRTMTMRALGIKAQAQAKNPIGKMLKGDVHYSLPFGIYLPVDKPTTLGKKTKAGKKDSVLMAVLATDPIHLEGSKNISLSLMGRVVPPPKGSKPSEANTHSAASQLVFDQGPGAVAEEGAHELEERNPQQEALSNFLSRFLRGEANTVFVRGGSPFAAPPNVTSGHDAMNGTDGEAEEPLPGEGSVLPGWLDSALRLVDLPISFPGSKVTDLIKNVTIEDLKITPHPFDTDKLVCSGTVMGVVNLPGQLSTVDVKITHLWPDILVFDGKPPSMQPKPPNSSTNAIGDQMNAEGEDEEPIPPLPDPLPKNAFARVRPHNFAPATTYQDPEDPDRKLLRSELKDVPITVLPGRGPIFRQFAWRIVNGEGALTGIEGKSRAKVWNSGLGTLELKNLPVKGAFLVGHRGDDAALDDKDETKH